MADNPPMGLTVVLVAEDEALIRMFTAGFLIEAGYTVVEASNAAEAITELESDANVRVLLTDVEMAGDMDGLELAREVQRRWPDVVIIVTSGRVRSHRDDLAGAEFFQKPLREEAVVETIKERLSR
jgi:two-component system, response regulator PdtaR